MEATEYFSMEEWPERSTKSRVRIIAVAVTVVITVLAVTVAGVAIHRTFTPPAQATEDSRSIANTNVPSEFFGTMTTDVPSRASAIIELPSGIESSTSRTRGRETLVYFATWGDGIKVFSPLTGYVNTAVDTTEQEIGVAYDTKTDYLYWTSHSSSSYGPEIHRSRLRNNGHYEAEEVLRTRQYGILRGMDSDWVVGNIYVVSSGGYILACDGRGNPVFRCAAVLSGQGDLRGIALHPTQGTMYWTKDGGSIVTAGMDGTNVSTIVSGLDRPAGITIDFHGSKLYWVDWESNKIQSSGLDGSGVLTVMQLSSGPYGIAVTGQRLYWSMFDAKIMQNATKTGEDIHMVHFGRAGIYHLTVPDWTVIKNRTNSCGAQACSGVCVLTPSSYKCL